MWIEIWFKGQVASRLAGFDAGRDLWNPHQLLLSAAEGCRERGQHPVACAVWHFMCPTHTRGCRSKHVLPHEVIWVKGSEKITFAPILYVDRVVCVNFTVFTVIFDEMR